MDTKGEKREARRRKRRKMGVSGRSLLTVQRIIAQRAAEAKRRREEAKW